MYQFENKSQFTNEQTEDVLKKKKNLFKRVIKIYALFFLILVAFGAGVFTSNLNNKTAQENVFATTADEILGIFSGTENIDPALFKDAWETLHQYYFKRNQISESDLFYGAISGMVAAVNDPYTIFLNPEVTDEFTQELNGSFFGIGAEIGRKNGALVIIAPLPDSPAEIAGLRAGDKILGIDEQDASSLSVDGAVNLIRGDKGTELVLTVLSKDENTPKEIKIKRDKIAIPSVTYKLEDNLAVIKISHFNSDTDSRFIKIAQQVLRDNPDGIILDLRNNPGGFLDVAVDIAGSWLQDGQVVVREIFSNQKDSKDYKAPKELDLSQYKMVILVNEGSASAAEILAGALQDYGFGTVIGQTTFGKGSVQQLFELKDGSALKVTVANWITPKGRTIDDVGVEPDEKIEYTTEDYNNDLDPQLDRAKEIIKE
ncbi:S41 family peptidase [Candidatus Nomurabacteria bacterium]|nr:S41 family peptidase [Candidatus Nomurabacteria bacterium]